MAEATKTHNNDHKITSGQTNILDLQPFLQTGLIYHAQPQLQAPTGIFTALPSHSHYNLLA